MDTSFKKKSQNIKKGLSIEKTSESSPTHSRNHSLQKSMTMSEVLQNRQRENKKVIENAKTIEIETDGLIQPSRQRGRILTEFKTHREFIFNLCVSVCLCVNVCFVMFTNKNIKKKINK